AALRAAERRVLRGPGPEGAAAGLAGGLLRAGRVLQRSDERVRPRGRLLLRQVQRLPRVLLRRARPVHAGRRQAELRVRSGLHQRGVRALLRADRGALTVETRGRAGYARAAHALAPAPRAVPSAAP